MESVEPGTLGELGGRQRIRQSYGRADRGTQSGWCTVGNRRHRGPQVQRGSVGRFDTWCAATAAACPDADPDAGPVTNTRSVASADARAGASASAGPAAESGSILHLLGR